MKTCLYNFDPLKPRFYIVKLGFTGVYISFLFFLAQKHRLWERKEEIQIVRGHEWMNNLLFQRNLLVISMHVEFVMISKLWERKRWRKQSNYVKERRKKNKLLEWINYWKTRKKTNKGMKAITVKINQWQKDILIFQQVSTNCREASLLLLNR